MTHALKSDTGSRNVKNLVRLGLGVAAAGAIVAAGLAPRVLAQSVPADAIAPTTALTTTIGQTQTLTLFVEERFQNFDQPAAFAAATALALMAVVTLLLTKFLRPKD